MNFDFKNGYKDESKGNSEKSCSCFRNRVSHKNDINQSGHGGQTSPSIFKIALKIISHRFRVIKV